MKMKTLYLLFGILLISAGCGKGKHPVPSGIIGEWLLVEELIDPGDGSGTFQPVSSDKKIEFFGNGTFEANGEMCSMTNQSSSAYDGTYDTSTETFSPNNCMSMAPLSYSYSVSGNTLILTYPCFEPCQQKYVRL